MNKDKREDEDSKNMYYYGARTTPTMDRCNPKRNNRVLLLVEEDIHCKSDQRYEYNSSSASFETLLPKNGFYNLDAFFDSDIISLDGSVLEEDEKQHFEEHELKDSSSRADISCPNLAKPSKRPISDKRKKEPPSSFSSYGKVLNTQNFEEHELKDSSSTRADISRSNLANPSKRPISYEKKKEQPSSSFSSQGKVLNTFAFDSLKRKSAAVAPEKKDEEASTAKKIKAKKIKLRTSPIQARNMQSKSDASSTAKRVIELPCSSISKEEEVQISDETKKHGTSLSNEIFQFYKVAKFKESDRGCKRDQLEIGYTGLACAYCDGSQGRKGGRYFPSSIKTIADPNKVLLSMHKHLQKCLDCPSSTKKHLTALHELYGEERATQARGSQRKFYKAIWDFLRNKDDVSE